MINRLIIDDLDGLIELFSIFSGKKHDFLCNPF